jgi:nucleotide-binding universal stress UspA family protein
MIKRILVPLDHSPFTDTNMNIATTIARINEAELTGLVVIDIPGIEKSIGPIPVGGLYYAEKIEKAKQIEAENQVHQLLTKFKQKCEAEGVTYREAELQGTPSEQIIEESIYYDAVMMGFRTYYKFGTDDKPGDSLEKVLHETVTPVYGVPERFMLPNPPKEKIKALIAFDGSLPSARALQRFAQLAIPGLFDVTILTSNEDKEKADYLLSRAESFLRCHNNSLIRKECTRDHIIPAIENKYLEQCHVVVGAHSKRDMFDFMIGSLTKHLIDAAKKPLLIGQ